MKRLLPSLALALLAGTAAGNQESPRHYGSQAPLQVSGDGPWYRLPVPIAVQLASAHGDLRDLRVFNAEGEALPYSLVAGATRQADTRREIAAHLFPLHGGPDSLPTLREQGRAGGPLVEQRPEGAAHPPDQALLRGWLLDAGALDAPLEQLVLHWSTAEAGFQRFTLEASDDLSHWRAWGQGQIARLDFNGQRIDQNVVPLPGAKARYLRLLWQSPEVAPQLEEARLIGHHSSSEPAPLQWSSPMPGRRGEKDEFLWELPVALPLERVRIPVPQANSLAPVTLSGRDKPTPTRRQAEPVWRHLASGVLYRLTLEGQQNVQEELQLQGDLVQQLRLRVDNRGGGLGREIPSLSIALRSRALIFLARGSAPYSLAVGRETANSAALPLSLLMPGATARQIDDIGSARLAGELARQARPPLAVAQNTTDWKRIGLWAALLLGVGILALMALSLLRGSSRPDKAP